MNTRAWMRPYSLLRLYRNRLRAHAIQELIAGLGVAIAVAMVFATLQASSNIADSANRVAHAVAGPAGLQLRARDGDGFQERLLGRVEHVRGVAQAAPLLEQTATVIGPRGRRAAVQLAGTNISLAILNGLAHTLPIATLSPGEVGLSRRSAQALGVSASGQTVRVDLRGRQARLKVSAVLGEETFGALADTPVAVMRLDSLQLLAGLQGRVSRIFVQAGHGRQASVRRQLLALTGGRLSVAPADQDVGLLRQALTPSNQVSDLFAAISALLGFLFAFNAMLLTVPERRQMIADLRMDGTPRAAIVQLVLSQAALLGLAASLVGLGAGRVLSVTIFHQSTGYLSRAFVLGSQNVITAQPVLLAACGGILATCLASMVPLLDLRKGCALDAVYAEQGMPGNALSKPAQRRLCVMAGVLLLMGAVLAKAVPSAAIAVCVIVALATMLMVPLTLAAVLRAAGTLAGRQRRSTILPVALTSLRATTLRSLALASTGAVALFGSVALGGSRDDLLRGIDRYTADYVRTAGIWLVNPGDNQAINDFVTDRRMMAIARLPGVARARAFQGSFLTLGSRRVWVIAWPVDTAPALLGDQIVSGRQSAASVRMRRGGWITVSAQIAAEHKTSVDGTLTLPTPSGEVPFRIAATTTNFGWSPGTILMSTADYQRAWGTTVPTALGIQLARHADYRSVREAIVRALGPHSGLEVLSARAREAQIDSSASEWLRQLARIAALLVLAAILAMTAALASSIWQQRVSLAALRLEGTTPVRLRRLLFTEAILLLSAGCVTGALAGVGGQIVIDNYLKRITGFPVASVTAGLLPVEIFAIVLASVALIATLPGWLASRVPPALALEE